MVSLKALELLDQVVSYVETISYQGVLEVLSVVNERTVEHWEINTKSLYLVEDTGRELEEDEIVAFCTGFRSIVELFLELSD